MTSSSTFQFEMFLGRLSDMLLFQLGVRNDDLVIINDEMSLRRLMEYV